MQPPPQRTITFKGRNFHWTMHDWEEPTVTIEQCDRMAERLNLGRTGREVVEQLTAHIQAHGPIRGIDAIRDTFEVDPVGPGRQNWAFFFKYACQQLDLLRYKRNPKEPRSWVVYAFEDQV